MHNSLFLAETGGPCDVDHRSREIELLDDFLD